MAVGDHRIAYNRRKVGREIRHVSDLWADDLKGRVTLLSGLDESFSLLMEGSGVDITRWTEDDFHHVRAGRTRWDGPHPPVHRQRLHQRSVERRRAGLSGLQRGRAIQLQADDPDIEFVVPEEGGELWAESLLIPNLAPRKANAEALIDFYYDPEVAALLAASVNYVCPVPAAREVLAASEDEETAALAENPLIFPDDDMRKRLVIARDITSKERTDFSGERHRGVVAGRAINLGPPSAFRLCPGAARFRRSHTQATRRSSTTGMTLVAMRCTQQMRATATCWRNTRRARRPKR